MQPIADIRRDYKLKSFDEQDAAANPFDQFKVWWEEAIHADIDEVNAMTLATLYRCGDCGKQYERTLTDEQVLEIFRNNYPDADPDKVRLVCKACYKIAMRILKYDEAYNGWKRYAETQ